MQYIVALLYVYSSLTIRTEGLVSSEISHNHFALTGPLSSNILTRKSYSRPKYGAGMAIAMIGGSDVGNETESRNTGKRIKQLAKDTFSSIQVRSTILYLFTTIGLAKTGKIGQYNCNLILSDLGATFLTGIASIIFFKTITRLSMKGILQSRDSRKIIHTFSAPSFMIMWPLFSGEWGARMFAATIALLQTIRLLLAGTNRGGSDGDNLTSAISRSGASSEVLEGPLIYIIVVFFTILVSWRDSLSSVIVLSTMAAGDGAADLVGRRLGKKNKWPFNKDKSVAGSSAFFIASTLCSIAVMWWFNITGVVRVSSFFDNAKKFALISAICGMVELFPRVNDNFSVPISAAILSKIFL